MAKNDKPKSDSTHEEPKERTTVEKLRDAGLAYAKAQSVADDAKDALQALTSDVAKNLIDNHNGAPIIVDGVTFAPKKSSKRKVDGVETAPKYPYTLVTKNDKPAVDLG